MITGHKNLNPLLVAEPFQASQGDEVPTSPKDLQDFYEDMERREIERRQSRGKSRRWTRRGSNKSDPAKDKSNLEHGEPSSNQRNPSDREFELHDGQAQATGRYTPLGDNLQDVTDDGHSSVAELRIGDLVPPPWSPESQEHVTSHNAPPSTYRTYYKIHNPVGPRFYRNHHLRPLNHSAVSAALRPSSAFSSAFPPLAALPPASPPPRGLGLGHAHLHPHNYPPQFPSPDTSFSSSESALPTPDSSQSALHGQGGEGLRKSNNVVNGTVVSDPVDQLDGSNPYGQKFHHDSPYDLGKKGKGTDQGSRNGARTVGSLSVTDLKPPRSRMSMQVPRKTTPSPLSQSTSALNIQSEGEDVFVPKRKLSKRRGGGLKNLFGPSPSPDDSPVDSRAPSPSLTGPAPIDHTLSVSSPVIPKESTPGVKKSHLSVPVPLTRKLSKSSSPTNRSTGSLASTSPARPPSPDKGGKQTGVFGRIAKRFSLARKPESSFMPMARRGIFDKGRGKESAVSLTTDKGPLNGMKKSDTEPAPEGMRFNEPRKSTDFLKRVPPPSLEPQSTQPTSSTHLSPTDAPSTSRPSAASSALPSAQSSIVPQLPDLITGTGLGIFQPRDRDSRRDSLTSLEPEGNWRLGKLTIANPDVPGGSETDLSVTVRGEGDARSSPPGNGDSRLSTRGDRDARGSNDRDARNSLREDPDVRVSRASVRADKDSLPVDVEARASLQSGDAHAPIGGNRGVSLHDLKESPLPPVPQKEQKAWSEQSVFDETPRASVVESTHTSIPRAPSPVLPLPPVPERLLSTPQKSLPHIETTQSRSDPPSRAEVYSPKSEPSSKPQPSLPKPEAPLPAIDPLESSTSSYAQPSRHVRQWEEHEYHINVPVEGSLFVRPAPNGTSVPPVEKPTLPPLPLKAKHRESTEKPSSSGQSFRPSSKQTTVFTSIFPPPSRSRHTSETSPNEGSSRGHGYVSAPAPLQRSRGHMRTGSYSPDKPVQFVYVRSGSESPDKEGRRERIKERDQERERRRDHRVAGTDSDRSKEDAMPRRERERRESSVRQRDKEYSDREREDRARDREERGRERDKDRGREREKEEEREDRDREKARQREKEGEERERKKERERTDRERDRERERPREKDRDREKAKDRERERGKDRERDRERERDKDRERTREKEREREKEKERERERERVKAREREKEKERVQGKEKEWIRRKEQDSRVERETVKYHLVPRHRTSSTTTSSNNHPVRADSRQDSSTDEDDLRKVSARGEDWEIVERTKRRRREGGSIVQMNGYSMNNATFPRRSSTSVQKDISQLTDRTHRDSRSGERGSDSRAGVPSQTSYPGSRQRAYSMETPHSRPSSTAPLSPPEKDIATKSGWREDDRYFQPSSSVPVQHVVDAASRPDPRSTPAPYIAPRPTSGFSSPDWAQFRAKEAWERDRMWRGHSMTFTPDLRGESPTASTSAPVHTGTWTGVSPHDQVPVNYGSGTAATFYHQPPPAHHGSSYTSFLVQPAWSYAQYSQPAPAPDPIPPFSLQPSSNPLPPPPRRSTFDTRIPPESPINRSTSPEAIR